MTILKLGQTLKNIINSINANFDELSMKSNVKYDVLFNGSATIPANANGTSNTITLTKSLTDYDGVIIQREDCGAWEYFGTLTVGTVLKPISTQANFSELMEGVNLFECNCEILSNNQLKLNNNVYTGATTSKTVRYITSYDETPLTKVIGIKLN